MGRVSGEKEKINCEMAVVKGRAAWIEFASGVQQLPNNLQQKHYNNTDEVYSVFQRHCRESQ